eukprot:4983-Chlamydomonas_euryale.AAC.2
MAKASSCTLALSGSNRHADELVQCCNPDPLFWQQKPPTRCCCGANGPTAHLNVRSTAERLGSARSAANRAHQTWLTQRLHGFVQTQEPSTDSKKTQLHASLASDRHMPTRAAGLTDAASKQALPTFSEERLRAGHAP